MPFQLSFVSSPLDIIKSIYRQIYLTIRSFKNKTNYFVKFDYIDLKGVCKGDLNDL
jgi:hypothetical protein